MTKPAGSTLKKRAPSVSSKNRPRLLLAFTDWDRRFLRLGAVKHYRDEPLLNADEPGEFTCPYAESAVDGPVDLPLLESAEEVHRAFTAPA